MQTHSALQGRKDGSPDSPGTLQVILVGIQTPAEPVPIAKMLGQVKWDSRLFFL